MSTDSSQKDETPADRLARRIVDQLVGRGLLTASDGEHLMPNLASGKLRREDWRLAVEKAQPRESEHE